MCFVRSLLELLLLLLLLLGQQQGLLGSQQLRLFGLRLGLKPLRQACQAGARGPLAAGGRRQP